MYASNGCILFYNLSQSLVVVIVIFFTALVIYLCMFLVIISIIVIVIGPIFNSTEIVFLNVCNLCTDMVVFNFVLLCRLSCR